MWFGKTIVAIVLLWIVTSSIPEINLAASTSVLNQEVVNFGPKLVEAVLNTTIDGVFSESLAFGVVKVDINVSEVKVNSLNIDWKKGVLVPTSDYTFRINTKGISLGISAKVDGHVSLKKIHTTLDVEISGINGYLDFKFSPPRSSKGIGFLLQISNTEIEVDEIDITFNKDFIDTYVAQTLVSLIRKSLPNIINSLMTSKVNDVLKGFCESRSFVVGEVGNHLYEISVNTTEVPRFINRSYVAIPLDILIANVDTGKINDEVDNDNLPLKPFAQNNSIEITISSGMVNTALWLIQDSGIVDLYINDTMVDASPIRLNTSDLTILLPDMSRIYGVKHGVYIHVTLSTKTPNLYIRGGRILMSSSVNLEFIVDLEDDKYPRNNLEQCLADGSCVSATVLNTSIIASVAIKIDSQNKLYGNVQTVKIVEVQPLSGAVEVNQEGLKRILNTLVPSMVSQVNQQLKKGVDVPLDKIYGYNVTNLMVKTELDYLAAGIVFDFQ